MLGRRCTGTYEIFLTDVRVPADRIVGGENKGWDVRAVRACRSSAWSRPRARAARRAACVDLALAYAKERKQFGRPIGTFQAIAHMLADMQTEVEAARALMWRAAWLVASRRGRAARRSPWRSCSPPRPMSRSPIMGMQIFGGYGYNMEFDMQRHFRDSRAATIAAGISQMQRNLHRQSDGPQGAVGDGMDAASPSRRLLRPRSVAIVGASPDAGRDRQQRARQSRALGLCRRDPSRQPQPRRDRGPPVRADHRRSAGRRRCGGAGRAGSGGARRGRGLRARARPAAPSCSPRASPRRGAEGTRAAGPASPPSRATAGSALCGPNCIGFTNFVDGVALTFEPLGSSRAQRAGAAPRVDRAKRRHDDEFAPRARMPRACRSPARSRPATRRSPGIEDFLADALDGRGDARHRAVHRAGAAAAAVPRSGAARARRGAAGRDAASRPHRARARTRRCRIPARSPAITR